MWSTCRSAPLRMRNVIPTHPARPLSIDQRAEDGGSSSLSTDIDHRITRSDAAEIDQVYPTVWAKLLEVILKFKRSQDEPFMGVTAGRSCSQTEQKLRRLSERLIPPPSCLSAPAAARHAELIPEPENRGLLINPQHRPPATGGS